MIYHAALIFHSHEQHTRDFFNTMYLISTPCKFLMLFTQFCLVGQLIDNMH